MSSTIKQTQQQVQTSPFQKIQETDFEGEIIDLQTEKYETIQFIDTQQYHFQEPFIVYDIQTKRDTQLFLTNYRIILKRRQNKSIPYGYIVSVNLFEKVLRINLKTSLHIDLLVNSGLKNLYNMIQDLIKSTAFSLNTVCKNQVSTVYDSLAQIDRMGVDGKNFSIVKNKNGSFCSTYPSYFVVPKNFSIDTLIQIKKCRNQGKIPIMSYYYDKTNTGIWRGANKRVNIKKEREIYDISYLKSIDANLAIFSFQQKQINMNKFAFNPLSIMKTKFHTFINKYQKIMHSCGSAKSQIFMKALSEWFEEINKLISFSYYVTSFIKKGVHVLLQQANGNDRVSQVMALCQIILDPFYRSFKGFSILVQKQFISFNHQFMARSNINKHKHEQTIPIFIQFLQCVHQLVVNHPHHFEYSSSYLATIGYEVYTNKYTNFLSLNSNDPNRQKAKHCPQTIWNFVARQRCHQNYQFNKKLLEKPLDEIRKKPSIKQYTIWINYYDKICKMNGQKMKKGSPFRQSKRLSLYLSQKSQK